VNRSARVLALLAVLATGCDDGGGSSDSSGGSGGAGGDGAVGGAGGGGGSECRPTGAETCDGADQDCDGVIDEGLEGDACSECGVAACTDGAPTCVEEAANIVLTDVAMPLEVEGAQPPAAAVGPDGALYVGAAGTPPRLWRVAPDGSAAEPVAVDTDAPGDRPAFACTDAGCTFAWWRSDGMRPGFYFMPAAGGAVSFHGLGTDHQPAHDRAWLSAEGALVRFPNSGRVDVQLVPLDERSAPRTVLTRLMFGRGRLLLRDDGPPALVEITPGNALAFYPGIDPTGAGDTVRDPVWTVNEAPDAVGFAEGAAWRLVWRAPTEPRLRTALLAADGAEIEAPRAVEWAVASLDAADSGASLWVAGTGTGAGAPVRYRRLARNGVWMPDAELAAGGNLNAVTLAGRDGVVWLVRNVSDGGTRTLRVARFGGAACP
jgi:hypothetical protein